MAKKLDEYAVKAAFVFNFIRFIQWPDTAFPSEDAPFRLCFIGRDDTGKQFKVIQGKKNGKRSLNVNQSKTLKTPETCDILFISKDVDPMLSKSLLEAVRGKPVLTIGESKNFTKQGGIINFFSKNNRLHFEINISGAKEQNLKLSSRLLNLAVIVEESK